MRSKGFTLIELLAVIVILGIFSAISFAGVIGLIDKSKETYYEKQENLAVIAAKSYYVDNRSKLPYEIGSLSSVSLSTLVEQKYIEPIVDTNNNACNSESSKVTVLKISPEEYRYWGYLECSEADYSTNVDTEKPSIVFSPNDVTGTYSIFTITMSISDNVKVNAYKYKITKNGSEVSSQVYNEYNKKIKILLYGPGTYQITAYAFDSSGNQTEQVSGIYQIN